MVIFRIQPKVNKLSILNTMCSTVHDINLSGITLGIKKMIDSTYVKISWLYLLAWCYTASKTNENIQANIIGWLLMTNKNELWLTQTIFYEHS